ncbi:hypothetical protein GBZ26_04455 [Azospirillum formosense]|uniref:Cysteine-rich CPCC domain-containing protein n=1 Tax=Azospirillum formosense TaxID=861533 RepID=A0ABX2KQR4_9PROT|nr:hypothetical protein [Azospirillum formosense]MBY3752468.1 hypothetical protein [Azospirillum formosense]NUB18475.1 hypothetical protein [Azospirillum formosense]
MMVIGTCVMCGDFDHIDYRTGLCEFCESEADLADFYRDPLWDGDPISFFAGIKATGGNHAF